MGESHYDIDQPFGTRLVVAKVTVLEMLAAQPCMMLHFRKAMKTSSTATITKAITNLMAEGLAVSDRHNPAKYTITEAGKTRLREIKEDDNSGKL